MVADARYLLAQLAIPGLGAGAAFHPSVRSMSVAARAAVSLAAGAVALTLEATLFSTLRLQWTVAGLAAPLLCLSLGLGWRWSRQGAAPRPAWSGSAWVAGITGLCCLTAVGFLGVSFFSSAATSVDYLFFWGVKAARFAAARGIDANFLRSLFSYHAVPDYPPLVPILQAWGALIAGRMPWRLVPILSTGWLAATIPIVFERCRRHLPDNAAAALTAFWTCALSVSSGGNAEAPLLFFETIAAVWLLTEREANESRFVPALALCGAALTKVEGSLAVACLVLGVALVERGSGRRLWRSLTLGLAPAAGLGVWFLYQRSQALPIGYRGHGKLLDLHLDHLGPILAGMLRFLQCGELVAGVARAARHAARAALELETRRSGARLDRGNPVLSGVRLSSRLRLAPHPNRMDTSARLATGALRSDSRGGARVPPARGERSGGPSARGLRGGVGRWSGRWL